MTACRGLLLHTARAHGAHRQVARLPDEIDLFHLGLALLVKHGAQPGSAAGQGASAREGEGINR